MFGEVKIAPSILSADFMNFERDIHMLEDAQADFIHVDVMDGHFVPNLTIGVPFVAQLRAITDMPLDVHLMISNPLEQLTWYLEAGADYVSAHIEAFNTVDEVEQFIDTVRSYGKHPALTLKPDKEIESLYPYLDKVDMVLVMSVFPGFSGQSYIEGSEDRVGAIAKRAARVNPDLLIEVDGGISAGRTAGLVCAQGADVLVAGSGVFASDNPASAVSEIRAAGEAAQPENIAQSEGVAQSENAAQSESAVQHESTAQSECAAQSNGKGC